MAKELPYFKFEPNQWENGNIQICTREDKGLFMDLCSMYWSRLGDLPFKLAVQKLCAGNATAFDSLIQEKIFTVIDGMICIDYLNEQLGEFDNTSKVNSKNAKDGWEKRRKQKELSERNATASNPQCENDAIREEEIREDKKRIEKKSIEQRKLEFSSLVYEFEETYTIDMLNQFFIYWSEHSEKGLKMRFEKEKVFDVSKRLAKWKLMDGKWNKQKVSYPTSNLNAITKDPNKLFLQ